MASSSLSALCFAPVVNAEKSPGVVVLELSGLAATFISTSLSPMLDDVTGVMVGCWSSPTSSSASLYTRVFDGDPRSGPGSSPSSGERAGWFTCRSFAIKVPCVSVRGRVVGYSYVVLGGVVPVVLYSAMGAF